MLNYALVIYEIASRRNNSISIASEILLNIWLYVVTKIPKKYFNFTWHALKNYFEEIIRNLTVKNSI